ncbi:MAG TPA: hypothetical protein VGZ90_16100 [Puia sp.]|jgi:hypothetical protein|nr:hypothetical protein [Puia sp.]
MTKLLTLKHWQLFGLLVGVPIILEFITISSSVSGNHPGNMFFIFPIILILFIGIYFSWFYSLGTNLYKRLPETERMNLTRFKVFLFIPIVYMIFLLVFTFGFYSNNLSGVEPNPAIFALIVPVHLFSMFCIFYCLYFNAKALKAVEWQRPVTFGDYAGEFFLLWFFPIGIWIIQPRINRLFDTTTILDDNINI